VPTMDDGAIAGRFLRTKLLKRGLGVTTHLGVDLEGGGPVVIKTVLVSEVPDAARLRLEHEARVLGRLDGLGSRAPVAVGQVGDSVYLVQPWIPGRSLRDRLSQGPLSVASALRVGGDVLHDLQVAHDGEVLHRDVKPANVIVDDKDPIERAVLIDFGFARSAWLDADIRNEPVGTARYLAPEAAGALDTATDERADLYAVGVLLFECLAGRPPFEGTDVGEVLRQHLNTPPPRLRALGIDVPRAVDAVIQRLLRKHPYERYQSAQAVLADLEQIADGLARGVPDPPVVVGLNDRRHALAEPAFVGRAEELAELAGFLGRAQAGAGGLVLLGAESGMGKSRMLDELAQQAGPSAWTLRGQGVDKAAQRPFQVLDGVAAEVLAAAAERPGLAAHIRRRLGERAGAAAAALPELEPLVAPGGVADFGPEAYGELRAVDALSALLDALGSPERPTLILLDDCQWADGLTLQLLGHWHRRALAEGTNVLVVAAYRSEEVGAGHPLRAIARTERVVLQPFPPADVRSLAESMAGPLPHEAVDLLAHLSEGNPFMASAILRGLVESGALIRMGDAWEVDPAGMAHAQTSRRAALFLVRRLELLSPPALQLLSVGAVLGKEFDLAPAAELAELTAEAADDALAEAARRRIVWTDGDAGSDGPRRCTFMHDKLREALLTRLDDELRRSLHQQAALRIEATDRDRVFELAYHFDAAGRPQRALDYALRAGALARAQHSLDIAAVHYRIAERAATGAAPEVRAKVAEALGDILALQGRYEEATAQLELARALIVGKVPRAAVEAKLGDVAFRKGDQRSARTHLEGALRLLGRWVPRRLGTFVLGLVWELLVQLGHTHFPTVCRWRRRRLEGAEDVLLAVRTYSRLAYVYWFNSGRVPCGWAHLREMNLAERYPPSAELAQAYSEHAPVTTMLPWFRRGIAYARKSLAIRLELDDVWGQGQSLHFYGLVLYAASRFRASIERCRDAVVLLERTGDKWEVNTATWHIAFAHYRLGELREAVEVARTLHFAALEIGDRAAAGASLSAWSRASNGQVPAELIRAQLDVDTADAQTATEVHLAEAVRLLAAGEVDGAITVLEAAARIVRRAGLRQEYVAPVAPWLATARRMAAEAAPPHRSRARRDLLHQADAAAEEAVKVGETYENNLPHALRERGLVMALYGHGWSANRLLQRSLRVAESQGARYEAALTRLAIAKVGHALAWRNPADLQVAEAEVAALLPAPPEAADPSTTDLSLADRFAGLQKVGRRVASATTVEGVWAAVGEAALTLLRGERCRVVAVDEQGALVAGDGDRAEQVSATLVRRALATRAPVVAGQFDDGRAAAGGPDGAGDGFDAFDAANPVTDSLVLADLRSVLCAPVMADGHPVACFYVTHAQVGGLFSQEEVQLAEFVATLAGAALEHLAGIEARFRSLAQNSTDVITIVDARGTIVYQSSSVERVFGIRPDELVGRPLSDWIHPSDLDGVLPALGRVGGGATIRPLIECRLRRGDGSWPFVETALNDLFDDPSVNGLVLNSRDVTERHALEAELRDRALRDDLTGLANRALFSDRVEHALSRAKRRPGPNAIVYLDLDAFKGVNDTLGHAAGDALLQEVARRLQSCVRPQDTVARLGGDEFAVLLEDASVDEAVLVAERIIAAGAHDVDLAGRHVRTRFSVGIAATGSMGVAGAPEAAMSEEPVGADELVSRADAAMYAAKSRGAGGFEVFDPAMRAAALERVSLKHDLQWAVEANQLDVDYQPIIRLGDSRVVGFEALLRWNHPVRGLLAPSEFIGLAEESGLIVSIGSWVIRQACLQARYLAQTYPERGPLGMSVNVSTRQLQHPGLVAEVVAVLEESGCDPHLLTLEITESASVSDPEATIARLRELKGLGVRLAVDDFGTGYSSLSYLRRFPVDQLKIDRSFVAGLGRNDSDTAIVASVIGLAHALGLEAVAEGVETVGQMEHLTRLKCDQAQGFNWCRPSAIEALEEWLTPGIGPTGAARQPARVLLVDDRREVRAAIKMAMELDGAFEVIAQAEDGTEAIDAAARLQPDMVVLDLVMPGMGGLEALASIRTVAPRAAVVLLTAVDIADVPQSAVDDTLAVLDKTVDLGVLVDKLNALAAAV
jgi:diguanylate cyclase (GGDEF)-like protein/PAS domain S-box-containing protein